MQNRDFAPACRQAGLCVKTFEMASGEFVAENIRKVEAKSKRRGI